MDLFKDLSKVNHELRSPLNGIVCMGSLLQDSQLNEDQKELLDYIMVSSRRVTALIDELIEASQLYGGASLHKKEQNISDLCQKVWHQFEDQIREKGLDGVYLAPEHEYQAYYDSAILESALGKILSNAVKFTPSGGSVGFKWRHKGDKLFFSITDTGCGIDSSNIEKIFDPFYIVHNDQDKVNKGIGLGLFIAKQAAELMGGELVLKSTSQTGSEFTLSIPVSMEADIKDPLTEQNKQLKVSQDNVSKKVLIVDDSEVNRYFLRTLLKKEGWVIAEAENGKTAVEMSAADDFDVILLDVNMPVMDGLEASILIKSRGKGEFLIGLTAHNVLDSRDILKRSGMDTIFTKPVDVPQLITTIESH